MLKYLNTEVVFEEIPDEVALAINITNCPNHCPGCHSPMLRDDIGEVLYGDVLKDMIEENRGITCVIFMGEGQDAEHLQFLIEMIRHFWPEMKVGLYTGNEDVSPYLWDNLDYVKLGPYIEELGPLNKETTNQRLYKKLDGTWVDITSKFWGRK